MTRSEPRRFGPDAKPLSALTDAELLLEVQRRRKKRGLSAGESPPIASAANERLAQYFANLELPASAGLDQIESAYERLRAKYEPYAHVADDARRQAAKKLLDSLERAYRGLLDHLERH